MSEQDYLVAKALRLKRPDKVLTLHSGLKPMPAGSGGDVPAPVQVRVPRATRKKWAPSGGAPMHNPTWVGEHKW